jgi:hypothetical protein
MYTTPVAVSENCLTGARYRLTELPAILACGNRGGERYSTGTGEAGFAVLLCLIKTAIGTGMVGSASCMGMAAQYKERREEQAGMWIERERDGLCF